MARDVVDEVIDLMMADPAGWKYNHLADWYVHRSDRVGISYWLGEPYSVRLRTDCGLVDHTLGWRQVRKIKSARERQARLQAQLAVVRALESIG